MRSTLPWLAPFGLFVVAVAIRAAHLGGGAEFDELYHVLAARGWLTEGELRIAEGIYDRTGLYTILIASGFGIFGESLEVARWPSVVAGAALAVAVFLWLRHAASLGAASVAGLLVCLWPDGIDISRFARFYALHGLLFWIGAVSLFAVVVGDRVRPALLVGAVAALVGAAYLQETTIIGLAGVGLWIAGVVALRQGKRGPRLALALLALGGLVGVGFVGVVVSGLTEGGIVGSLLDRFRSTPPWLDERRDAFWFYHLAFLTDYPTLWPCTAIAVVVAFARHPAATAFCTTVFALAFLVHSLAGAKSFRYIYYAVPFLFAIWAMAIAALWQPLRAGMERFARAGLEQAGAGTVLSRPAFATGLSAAALAVQLVLNGATAKMVAALAGVHLPPNRPPAQWERSKATLATWLDEADVILTTSELETLYYLGDYDVLISRSRLYEVGGEEFGRDHRTGRPVVADWRSIETLIACHEVGLIVSPEPRWRRSSQLDDAAANVIVAHAKPIPLEAHGLLAYGWRHGDSPEPAPGACDDLPAFVADWAHGG